MHRSPAVNCPQVERGDGEFEPNTVTLVTNTYDGGTLTNVANLVAHDASYGTSFTYRGNLTHAVSPGSIRNVSYDIGGSAISSNDGYGHTLSSTYSTATQYTAPDKLSPGSDNLATTLTYTQFLGLSTLTQPGATSSAQYDSYARPTQTTSPLGAVTTYTYDPNNPRLTTATTGTRIVKTTVDGLGRTVKVEVGDASGMKSIVDTEYDSCACSPLGRVKRVSRPYAPNGTVYWTTYTYDALGRPTQITLPDGSITTYAYSGNTTTVTDPAGKWKTYTSDALGNLLQVTEPNPQGGADHQTYYTYNLLGQLTQVQMPRGAVTQNRYFNYDLTTGRLTSTTNAENGTVSFTYNADGTPLRKTDARSKAVEFSYDSYQRVTQKRTYPWGGSTEDPCGRVDFYYDTNPLESNWPSAWGQLMAMRWSNASCPGNQFTESYQYGAGNVVTYKRLRAPILTAGNYTSSTDNLDASFSYTTEGQLHQINYPTWYNNGTPGQNLSLHYAFDTVGRPVSANDQNNVQWANNATYAPDGAPTAVTFVGTYSEEYGASYYNETRSYNVRGQLTRLTSGSTVDLQYLFPANNDGRINQQKDWKSGKVIDYQYDSLGRLSSAATTSPEWGQSFSYDGFGNMTAEVRTKGDTAPSIYLNYNGTTNRIVTAGYGYDSSGNLTTMPDLTLTYDTDSRLTQAVHTTNGTERYGYNPLGQRVWKQYAGGGGFEGTYEVLFYGVQGELLASFDYSGGPSYSTRMRQGPMYYFAGRKFWTGDTQAYREDRLGTRVTSSTGTYFPYGDQPLSHYATYNRDTTNLDYAQQRYYSSQILRFTTPDPYGGSMKPAVPQSFNRYAYAGGDPVNYNDPTGLQPEVIDLRPWSWRCGFAGELWPNYMCSLGPRRPGPLPLDPGPTPDLHELLNKRLRKRTQEALEDLAQRCKDALAAAGINLGRVEAIASSTDYYNAAGAEGTMPVNKVTGFPGPWPPGLQGANLSMWLGSYAAVVLPDRLGGVSNTVVVGSLFLNADLASQDDILVHEALHTGTAQDDVGLYTTLGLGPALNPRVPSDSITASADITRWLANDCRPIH